jgi:hypothetical protein
MQEVRDLSVMVHDLAKTNRELQMQVTRTREDTARPPSPDRHHLVTELADLKSKFRRLKQEL